MNLASYFFFISGFISIIFFSFNIFFPIILSVFVTLLIVIFFIYQLNIKQSGILIVLLFGIYTLPFIHIIPFIWFDFNAQIPDQLWWWHGYSVEYSLGYMADEKIIRLTAMLGVTGALGIAFGASINKKKIKYNSGFDINDNKLPIQSMNLVVWFIWLFVGCTLGLLSASESTIFQAMYTTSKSFIDKLNFSSAGMMYMIILTFVFSDSILDHKTTRKKIKLFIIFPILIYIIIWLEIFRGEREAIAWIFGLFLAYNYWAKSYLKGKLTNTRIPFVKIIILILIFLLLSMILGYSRSQLVGVNNLSGFFDVIQEGNAEGTINFYKMFRGTWTGVLLTPLSVAGDYINGLLDFKFGVDYLNVILSIPPGFIADFFNYERPLTNLQGPAYDVSFGAGGVHAIVVPFKNFSIFGVFLISSIWSFIFSGYERNSLKKLSTINLSFLITIVFVAPEWLWYGDKYSINAIIIWLVLSFLYKVSLSLKYN